MTNPPPLLCPYVAISSLLLLVLASGKPAWAKREKSIAVLLMLLTVSYFFYIIISFSTNAAFIDDFNLLASFHRMLYSAGSSDRIKAAFEQVNEHRFAFERLLMYLIHLVFGSPDVRIQIITGNLFMLGILWLFFRFFRQSGHSLFYFVPVVLILFNLVYYENAYWGIAAIQNTPLIFFAMLSVYGLSRQSAGGNTTALLSALAASFTSGSGISVWIVGILLLIVQKRYRFLLVWLAVAVPVAVFYFTFDYTFYPKDRSDLWKHPFRNAGFFLCFIGGLFYGDFDHGSVRRFYPDVAACVLAGLFVLLVCLWWLLAFLRNRTGKTGEVYSFLSGTVLFLLATAAMLVLSRPLTVNILFGGQFISQRYLIFGSALWASVYLALLYLKRNSKPASRKIFLGFLFLNAIINFTSYYWHIPALAQHKAVLGLDKFYTDSYGGMLLSSGREFGEKLFWNHPTAFTSLLKNLDRTGLYRPAQKFDKGILKQARQQENAPVSTGWEVVASSENAIGFEGRPSAKIKITADAPGDKKSRPEYFILQSKNRQFILPAVPERASLPESVKRLSYWSGRHSFTFREHKFPPDRYKILVVTKNEKKAGDLTIQNTGKTLGLKHNSPYRKKR